MPEEDTIYVVMPGHAIKARRGLATEGQEVPGSDIGGPELLARLVVEGRIQSKDQFEAQFSETPESTNPEE